MTRLNINLGHAAMQLSIWRDEFPKETTIFSSESPINEVSLTGQTLVIFNHLQAGNTITFIEARVLGITLLSNRIAELKSKNGVAIYHRSIRINGNVCNEYSLSPFE